MNIKSNIFKISFNQLNKHLMNKDRIKLIIKATNTLRT